MAGRLFFVGLPESWLNQAFLRLFDPVRPKFLVPYDGLGFRSAPISCRFSGQRLFEHKVPNKLYVYAGIHEPTSRPLPVVEAVRATVPAALANRARRG